MNESFSELKVNGEFDTDSEYLEYFNSLQDNVIQGYTSVPVFGGLTAGTEFEFMTGFSNAFFPTGIIAYQNYVKEGTKNLSTILKDQGYYSIFMHPMDSSGWNRKNVYQYFGFDETYNLDTEWHHLDSLRSKVTDSANYQEVIMRYEEAKEKNEQVFIFNVTMQNHGGYETEGYEKTVHITSMAGDYPMTEEYLSLMKESDKAFQELIDYFSQQEQPVLICMFGDHQPSVEEEFYEELWSASDESELMRLAKKYQTPFIIWTNYEIEEQDYPNISVNYLQDIIMETADLPLDDYQKYLETLYEEYPVINIYGVMDRDGNWYDWTKAQEFEKIKEYQIVQYWELFNR